MSTSPAGAADSEQNLLYEHLPSRGSRIKCMSTSPAGAAVQIQPDRRVPLDRVQIHPDRRVPSDSEFGPFEGLMAASAARPLSCSFIGTTEGVHSP